MHYAAPINPRDPPPFCLSLPHCFTHVLPHLSLQDWILSCRLLSYIKLIARLGTSTRYWIILLEHSLCRSYSSGKVWSRIFYLFLARDSSRHDVTGLAGHRNLGATVLCYNTLPVLFSYTVSSQQPTAVHVCRMHELLYSRRWRL